MRSKGEVKMSESKIIKAKRDNRVKMIAIITMVVLLMAAIGTVIVNSISYYTVRINYFYSDGSPAHDPYIATFSIGEPVYCYFFNRRTAEL